MLMLKYWIKLDFVDSDYFQDSFRGIQSTKIRQISIRSHRMQTWLQKWVFGRSKKHNKLELSIDKCSHLALTSPFSAPNTGWL